MRKLTFRRIRGVERIEIDLEHLTVIAGDDGVGKEVLMTCMYAMVESTSDPHEGTDRASVLDDILEREFDGLRHVADGASMEADGILVAVSDATVAEGSSGVSRTILYDSPSIVRGVSADDRNHRSELWGMLRDDRPDVHPLDAESEGYRSVMGVMCPGDLEPEGDGLTYRLPDGGTVDVFSLSEDIIPFAVLKRLRAKGFLSEGTLLMMINPDAGMHNTAVNRFSEVLGSLVGDMGVGVVLSTNGLDLVEACRVFPYAMGVPVDFKMVRDGTDPDCRGSVLAWSLDRPLSEAVLEMRRNGYPYDTMPCSRDGIHVSVEGVRGVPDFNAMIDRMTVVSGCGGIPRARIADLMYSVLEPLSSDHDGEDRSRLIRDRIDEFFGGMDNYRIEGVDSVFECDGVRVGINGDVVVEGVTGLPHVVHLDETLGLTGCILHGAGGEALSRMMSGEPYRPLDSEPEGYRRIMDGSCPGVLEEDGGVFRFIRSDGSVSDLRDVTPFLRMMAVIRRLRSNGCLCEGSLLIVRNPEVHIHPDLLVSLVELLVVMSGHMGVRVVVLTQDSMVVVGSHILSCRHGTGCRYFMVSDGSIDACTSLTLNGIFIDGAMEINDYWWGEDE